MSAIFSKRFKRTLNETLDTFQDQIFRGMRKNIELETGVEEAKKLGFFNFGTTENKLYSGYQNINLGLRYQNTFALYGKSTQANVEMGVDFTGTTDFGSGMSATDYFRTSNKRVLLVNKGRTSAFTLKIKKNITRQANQSNAGVSNPVVVWFTQDSYLTSEDSTHFNLQIPSNVKGILLDVTHIRVYLDEYLIYTAKLI
jgi:hypothetical protein